MKLFLNTYCILLAFTMLINHNCFAQNDIDTTVNINGVVLNEYDEPIIAASVEVYVDKELIEKTTTDFDGKYILNNIPLTASRICAKYIGYKIHDLIIDEVNLKENNTFNFSMTPQLPVLTEYEIIIACPPMIDKFSTGNKRSVSGEEIQHMSR